MPATTLFATTLIDRALLRIAPTDPAENARDFLQGLVTNDLRRLTATTPLWAGLLSAQGKALFDFIMWDGGSDVLIDCEAAFADELARRLTLYRLRRKLSIARDDTLFVHWSMAGDGGVPDPRLPALGRRWLAAEQGDDASAVFRAHRLALGVPEGRTEIGHDATLWLETNAIELNGVAFDKGCYVGQENTARMNWRQKINRRLVVLPVAEADPKRVRQTYADLGLAIEHRRVEDMRDATLPDWQADAIAQAESAAEQG